MIPVHCGTSFVWLAIVVFVCWLCLSLAHHEFFKRRKLQKRGDVTTGTVRDLRREKGSRNDGPTYYVDYVFEVDMGHSKTVVHGYLRREEKEGGDIDRCIEIPPELQQMVLSFYGVDAYKTQIRGTHEISFGLYCTLHYGDELDITYDSRFPKRRHIPTLEYEFRGKCYWVRYLIGALVMMMLYLILSSVNCQIESGNTKFVWIVVLFGMYSLGIITCCGLLRSMIILLYLALKCCCGPLEPESTTPSPIYLRANTRSDSMDPESP